VVQGWRSHRHPHPPSLFSLLDFIIILSIVMPRSIVLHPPGGDSGVRHRCYTAREKISITAKICHIKRETNCSYRQAAASIGFSHTLVLRWHAIREHFNNIDIKKLPHYSTYQGYCGELESVTEELLTWIFERREMGLVVSTLSVIIKACCLLPPMQQKSALARYCVVRRFLKKHSIVHRMGGRRHCSAPPARCAKRCRSSRILSI
jgi:hypothetical protein